MDEGGRENRRHRVDYHKVPQWNAMPQYPIKEPNSMQMLHKFGMLCNERDGAIREQDRALAEKKSALDERDAAIKQLDAAIMEQDEALRERDNAIADLQFDEVNALLSGNARGTKRTHHPTNNYSNNMQSAMILKEECMRDALPVSHVPHEGKRAKINKDPQMRSARSPKKVKKIGEDLNRQVTTDGSKAEWDAQDLGSMNQIIFDESSMPVPVCSCTGVPRQCYKSGNGGWQSSYYLFTTSSSGEESVSTRPMGNKASKAAAKGKGKKKSMPFDELFNFLEEIQTYLTSLVESKKEKLRLKREAMDMKILYMDTTKMTPEQLNVHSANVAEILQRRSY